MTWKELKSALNNLHPDFLDQTAIVAFKPNNSENPEYDLLAGLGVVITQPDSNDPTPIPAILPVKYVEFLVKNGNNVRTESGKKITDINQLPTSKEENISEPIQPDNSDDGDTYSTSI